MTITLGSFALRSAFFFALAMPITALTSLPLPPHIHRACCGCLAGAMAVSLGISLACLATAFVTGDFSLTYVAANSSSELPLLYRLTAIWGEHEGSLFLWLCLLGAWTAVATMSGRNLPAGLARGLNGTLGLIAAIFGGFICWTADPFTALPIAPGEGGGLNPLLQNPAMALHPPLLYAGYAGTAVPFALALSMLLTGRVDAAAMRWLRPFATAAWLLLTLGILIGSYWSYTELGWGGFWFWDPIENASLMPWLIVTALVHSLAGAARHAAFLSWALLQSIAAFALSLLGTFIMRAGFLASVHSFATAPDRGLLLLAGFGLLVLATGLLSVLRAGRLPALTPFRPAARESFVLINNLLLLTAAAVVFVGTFYPILADTTGVSVGAAYYETVLLPLAMVLLVTVCAGAQSAWGGQSSSRLKRGLIMLLLSLVAGIGLPLAQFGATTAVATAGIAAGLSVTGSALTAIGPAGMRVAHAGLGLLVIGITVSGAFGVQADRRLEPLRPARLGAYEFRLGTTRSINGPNYSGSETPVDIFRGGRLVGSVSPQQRHYRRRQVAISETGILSRWRDDVQVALGNDLGVGIGMARLQYRPLIRLVWLGGLLMVLGSLVALVTRRLHRAPAAGRHVRW